MSGTLSFPADAQTAAADAWRMRQLIDGNWRDLLYEHITIQLGPQKARLVGLPDTSENLLASVVDQTCTIYDAEPEVQHPDPVSLEVLKDSFERGGWWLLARQHQRYVRAMTESLVYVGWDHEMGHCSFELATRDCYTVEFAPSNKQRPVTVWWGVRRPVHPGSQELGWFWDRWSVADGVGSYSIWTNGRRRDVTARYADPSRWNGAAYPFRDENGRPILPFARYVRPSGMTGDLATGALQVGMLWTAAVHGMLRASYDQRWIANGKLAGGTVQEAGGGVLQSIAADPTTILQIKGEGAQAGAWGASVDVDKAERFARSYGNRLAVSAGLSAADVMVESLNPQSGASLTVSEVGKRKIAKKDLPYFRRGDSELAAVVASVNRAYGRPCSAAGFRLRYHGIALTPAERLQVGQHIVVEDGLGLIDDAAAYQELHPGVSREDAEAELAQIRMERERKRVLEELRGPPVGVG